jgi:hypothetical protein
MGGPGGCLAGVHPITGRCITLGITTDQPELSTLMNEVAEIFSDVGDTCVPVIVETGRPRPSFL